MLTATHRRGQAGRPPWHQKDLPPQGGHRQQTTTTTDWHTNSLTSSVGSHSIVRWTPSCLGAMPKTIVTPRWAYTTPPAMPTPRRVTSLHYSGGGEVPLIIPIPTTQDGTMCLAATPQTRSGMHTAGPAREINDMSCTPVCIEIDMKPYLD